MDYLLIVEQDEKTVELLEQKLNDCMTGIQIITAQTLQEASELIIQYAFKVVVAAFNLPDAANGEIIDTLNEKGIPAIALTDSVDEAIQKMLLEKNLVEFVSKHDPRNLTFVAKVVKRVLSNYNTRVLVVEDDSEMRKQTTEFLRRMNLQVYEAGNGIEAIEMIDKSQNSISLVVTDYRMPKKDGMQLTMKLRESYNKEQLCIIALSTADDPSISTNFLKRGANDYLKKPFSQDELTVRVNANLEILDLLRNASDLANRDYLTGVYNRRFFFESGKSIVKKAIRSRKSLFIAMLDIDHFKQINDTYGHDIGDEALKYVSKYLSTSFRSSDLVARIGGEEFSVLLEEISLEKAIDLFETIRLFFENNTVRVGPHEINFTISIGVFHGLLDDLDDMVKEADMGLYTAKKSGRNRIVVNDELI